jgi:hypothetical protein
VIDIPEGTTLNISRLGKLAHEREHGEASEYLVCLTDHEACDRGKMHAIFHHKAHGENLSAAIEQALDSHQRLQRYYELRAQERNQEKS